MNWDNATFEVELRDVYMVVLYMVFILLPFRIACLPLSLEHIISPVMTEEIYPGPVESEDTMNGLSTHLIITRARATITYEDSKCWLHIY